MSKIKSGTAKLVRMGLLLFLCAALGIGTVGCAEYTSDDRRPSVVATIFPPYDFARNVCGDLAKVTLLVDVTDSHSYSPTALDMVAIEECDIFIYTGGEGDRWAEDFISTIDHSGKIILNMLELADALEEEITEGMLDDASHSDEHHGHEDGNEEAEYDEHVWLAPLNAAKITAAICDALCAVDQANEQFYRNSFERYQEKLYELDADFQAVCQNASRQTILVADRFPFRYLCEAYGLRYYAALPGCSSAADLTAIQYEVLAEKLRSEDLPVILTVEYSDQTIARTVLRESGRKDIEILTLHSCHTLPAGQISAGVDYLSLMRENLEVLKKALN